jgi:hypothetical protein
MSGKCKGQYFMLGAIIISLMLYLGLSPMVYSPPSEDYLHGISENIEEEVPHALNLALAEDSSPAKLGQFSGFLGDKLKGRGIGFEALWVASIPDPGNPSQVDVYIGNWIGRPVSVDVSIDGDLVSKNLDHEEMSFDPVSGVSREFDMTVMFEGRSWTGSFVRDKSNLYYYSSISKNSDITIKDIAA